MVTSSTATQVGPTGAERLQTSQRWVVKYLMDCGLGLRVRLAQFLSYKMTVIRLEETLPGSPSRVKMLEITIFKSENDMIIKVMSILVPVYSVLHLTV